MSEHNSAAVDPFRALANSDRREILRTLCRRLSGDSDGLSIGKIAGAVELTRFATSRHLRILEASGMVTSLRAGTATHYVLRVEGLWPVDDWLRDFFTVSDSVDCDS